MDIKHFALSHWGRRLRSQSPAWDLWLQSKSLRPSCLHFPRWGGTALVSLGRASTYQQTVTPPRLSASPLVTGDHWKLPSSAHTKGAGNSGTETSAPGTMYFHVSAVSAEGPLLKTGVPRFLRFVLFLSEHLLRHHLRNTSYKLFIRCRKKVSCFPERLNRSFNKPYWYDLCLVFSLPCSDVSDLVWDRNCMNWLIATGLGFTGGSSGSPSVPQSVWQSPTSTAIF